MRHGSRPPCALATTQAAPDTLKVRMMFCTPETQAHFLFGCTIADCQTRNQYFLQRLQALDEGLHMKFRVHLGYGGDEDYDTAAILLLTDGLHCDERINVVANLVTGCWRVRCSILQRLRERRAQQVSAQR
jgi:hypothetical protein